MPRIKLQEKSPLFDDDKPKIAVRVCDMPECVTHAEHRAPKNRGLNEYYNFCYEHVSSYNRAWNYFDGMPERDVEDYIYNGTIWDRPTWKFATEGAADEILRQKTWQTYHFTEKEAPKSHKGHYGAHNGGNNNQSSYVSQQSRNTPEFKALEELGLAPPVTLEIIKAAYKTLVKKYHPDVNSNCPMAEEKSKNINAAYTMLRLSYEKYEKLEEKFKG